MLLDESAETVEFLHREILMDSKPCVLFTIFGHGGTEHKVLKDLCVIVRNGAAHGFVSRSS